MNHSSSVIRHSSLGQHVRAVKSWQIIVLWAVLMFPLTFWGLPTAGYDPYLFGGDEPWPPEGYQAAQIAAELRERQAGADVDRDPLAARDRIVDLTATDADRAEILVRYRLYSRQPDEMITLRALQRMNPRRGDFDPKLFQYGGAYIYLVGAAIGLAHLLGLAHVTSDIGYYLADPDAFGRFYVVARFWSLVFGGLLLEGVFRLARRAAGEPAGWIALLLVAAAPVFISGALEAKPHILSAAMIVWAILAALHYVDRPSARRIALLGLLAGAALAFVLTGLVAVVLIPLAVWLADPRASGQGCGAASQPDAASQSDAAGQPPAAGQLAAASQLDAANRPNAATGSAPRPARWTHVGIGVAAFAGVYALTNPYVIYNALFNPEVLASNLSNSTAMYSVARLGQGAWRVLTLLYEGAGLAPLVGLLTAIVIAHRRPRAAALVAAGPLLLLAICVAIGAGKPAEFARFLVAPVAVAGVAAAMAVARLIQQRQRLAAGLVAVALIITLRTPAYLRAFADDASLTRESRFQAAGWIAAHTAADEPLGLVQEPAPYAVPPLDFTRRPLRLLPAERPAEPNPELPTWLVITADSVEATARAWWRDAYALHARMPAGEAPASPITWANKPVLIFARAADK